MPDGEFFPPVQYLPWWGLIGFLLLMAVVGWYIYLVRSTRASRAVAPVREHTGAPSAAVIRTRYLGLIDETLAAHSTGALGVRECHQQLSLLLRTYVEERGGARTMNLTLAELRETPLAGLSQAVAKLYPGEFQPEYRGTVAEAADEARRLVTTWS